MNFGQCECRHTGKIVDINILNDTLANAPLKYQVLFGISEGKMKQARPNKRGTARQVDALVLNFHEDLNIKLYLL